MIAEVLIFEIFLLILKDCKRDWMKNFKISNVFENLINAAESILKLLKTLEILYIQDNC